ncbi:MmcQ/YjbR family DNA-binding protein [Paenibacillus daejeonensis]|uniref:MmcQ/YjbR family DNA-binding protein n=1 Tax=Paenibacillus daejeonensis TaxID=135193 RepID=UPI00036ACAD3|nr:MmcQ/YjbR family DNA-binding protein [Paenibacillus daejeonensis]
MNAEQLKKVALGWPGTTVRCPFYPDMPVLFVGSKMFALLSTYDGVESVNLKTLPEEAWLQRETYPGAVIPGYHMNKKHWNTVLLDGRVPEPVILTMLQESYRLVWAKLTRAEREVVGELPRFEENGVEG